MSKNSGGMGSGMIPNATYFAKMKATRASMGIAGYGRPSSSTKSISALRSTPEMLKVEKREPAPPGVTLWFVTTPSMRTSGMPLIVATRITRMNGTIPPPASKKIVCSGESFESEKSSLNALCAPSSDETVISTLCSASSATCGTGTGMTGPASRVR
jgi:hypothetical protein